MAFKYGKIDKGTSIKCVDRGEEVSDRPKTLLILSTNPMFKEESGKVPCRGRPKSVVGPKMDLYFVFFSKISYIFLNFFLMLQKSTFEALQFFEKKIFFIDLFGSYDLHFELTSNFETEVFFKFEVKVITPE